MEAMVLVMMGRSTLLTQRIYTEQRCIPSPHDPFYFSHRTSGIPPSYFSYNITSWELNGLKNDVGLPLVNAKSMSVGRFPLFLEGPTRYLKTVTGDSDAVSSMYDKVKVSGLRDEELKMYYVSASLEGQSYDMGRMMAFTPGWLENQSIWSHMSYKYYLELLRGKLYDTFYSEMRGGGKFIAK